LRPAEARRAVLRWARTLDRPLPWRGERDPYRLLVSEVMLQQTQAARVAELYPRFLARFPTVEALGAADPAEVLRAWENLGYNRRALNLWRTAQAVVARGGFPRTVDELLTLPGVGAYTARAVASFAFDVDAAAVDANVRRVVSRFYGDGQPQALADRLVPPGKAATWNQAMIDLGAVVCTARDPRCGACPLREACAWNRGYRPTAAPSVRQPRFETTSRYARGRVVEALRSRPMSLAVLRRETGLPRSRVERAVASLAADQLVHVRRGAVALGPASARGRAAAGRR
jgi:A/G-specific adenine glycosylase